MVIFRLALVLALLLHPTAQGNEKGATLAYSLEIDPRADRPILSDRLEIVGPAAIFDGLRASTPGSDAYGEAIDALLAGQGYTLPPGPLDYRVDGPTPAPGGQETLALAQDFTRQKPKGGIHLLGPLAVAFNGESLIVKADPQGITADQPVQTRVHIQGVRPQQVGISRDLLNADQQHGDEDTWVAWPVRKTSSPDQGIDCAGLSFSTMRHALEELYGLSAAKPVTVKTFLTLDATNLSGKYAIPSTRVEIQTPHTWPFVDGLRLDKDQKPVNQERLDSFLATLWYGESGKKSIFANSPMELSSYSVDSGGAHLTINLKSDLSDSHYAENHMEGALGRFTVDIAKDDAVLHIGDPVSQQYPWVKSVIVLHAIGLDIRSADPAPDVDNGSGLISWTIPAGRPQQITVHTGLPPAVSTSLSSVQFNLSMVTVIIDLLLSLVYFWVFFGIFGKRRLGAVERGGAVEHSGAEASGIRFHFPPETSRFRDVIGVLLALLLLVLLLQQIISWLYLPLSDQIEAQKLPFTITHVIVSITILGLVAFTVFSAAEARRKINLHPLLLALTGAALLAGLGTPLVPRLLGQNAPAVRYTQPWMAALVIDAVLLALLTLYVLVGILAAAAAVTPGNGLGSVSRRLRVTGAGAGALLTLAALAELGQWSYAMWKDRGFSSIQQAFMYNSMDNYLLQEYTSRLASMLFFTLLPLFLLLGLVNLISLARKEARSPIFSTGQRWVILCACLLFGMSVTDRSLVLGYGSYFLGIPLGFLLTWFILPRLLNRRRAADLEAAQAYVESHNPRPACCDAAKPVLVCCRKELIQRAKAIMDLKNQYASLYSDYSKNSLDLDTYNERLARLQSEITWIQRGGPAAPVEPGATPPAPVNPLLPLGESAVYGKPAVSLPAAERVKIKRGALTCLPETVTPGDLALGLGPKDDWWQNAVQAMRYGLPLALLPVGYYLYVLFTARGSSLLTGRGVSVIGVLAGIANEAAFWLVSAFVMGLLYLYLPGSNGALKAMFLTGVYALVTAAVTVLQSWFGASLPSFNDRWVFTMLQLLVFLMALGVLMDLASLRENGLYWREMVDLYNLQNARTLVGYLSPVALSLFGIIQQVISGAASDSIVTEILKNAGSILPNLKP